MPPTTRATARAQQTDAATDPTAGPAGTLQTATSARTEQHSLQEQTETDRNTMPQAETIENLLTTGLPRTETQGIGRYTIDNSRVMDTLGLDTTTPLMPQRVSFMTHPSQMTPEQLFTHQPVTHQQSVTHTELPREHENLSHQHVTNHPSTNDHMQMTATSRYEALVHILVLLGAKQAQADKWAMHALCGDEDAAISTEGLHMIEKALQRLPILFPHLEDTVEQQNTVTPNSATTTVSRQQGNTAVLGNEGARFTISYPPRFNPEKSNWFLWQPQVERFLLRVHIDPRILHTEHAASFTDAQHATVLTIITEISPPRETEWFARLNFTKASQAWQELQSAYAPRAELELQAKLEDLEIASQSEGESIREWTLRLRRLALEIRAMSGQHVITDTAHKLKLLRIRPVPGAEEGCNTFLAGIRYLIHQKSVQQVEQELIAYEDGIQMQTRLASSTSHLHVWHTRTDTQGPHNGALPTRTTFRLPKEKGLCYICYNATPSQSARHHMRECPQRSTALGRRVNELMDKHRDSAIARRGAKGAMQKKATPPPPAAAPTPGAGF
jgi:hypothetical protein